MTGTYEIRVDDLRSPQIAALLLEHLEFAAQHSPPESRHALDVEALRAPDVTFWSAWRGDELAGCAALHAIDDAHGEIKSMRTASSFRRQGVASALLEHLVVVARERSYRRLSLETGAPEAFAPARALYTRFGFEPCGPFGDYALDANSVFMTRALAPSRGPPAPPAR